MTDRQLIANFKAIQKQQDTIIQLLTAIGLSTGALITKSKPDAPTRADLFPEELEELKEWENKCDEEIASMPTPKFDIAVAETAMKYGLYISSINTNDIGDEALKIGFKLRDK